MPDEPRDDAAGARTGWSLPRRLRPLEIAALVLPWSWFVVRTIGGTVDALAIGLPFVVLGVVVAGLVAALVVRRVAPLLLVGSTVAVGLVAVLGPAVPRGGEAPVGALRIVQANLAALAGDGADDALRAISARDPDVVVIEELNPALEGVLAARFPHHDVTDLVRRDRVGEESGTPRNRAFLGVFSRFPFRTLADDTGLAEGLPGLRLDVDGPEGTFRLYALHLPRPSPVPRAYSTSFAGRGSVLDGVLASAARTDGPVVIVGDLNISDREQAYRRIADTYADAMRSHRWAWPTSVRPSPLWRLLWLRIDHVFTSRTWCSDEGRDFTLPGSDHRGIAVDIGPCPNE